MGVLSRGFLDLSRWRTKAPRRRRRSASDLLVLLGVRAGRGSDGARREFRKASSRRRCSSVLRNRIRWAKVSSEGRKVTAVPVLRLAPRGLRCAGRLAGDPARPASPRSKRISCTLPARQIFRSSQSDRALTTADADAVQAAGHLVAVLVELTAGVQLGHDDLGRGDALFLVDVGGDAAPVVGHRDRAVGVQGDARPGGIAGQGLVDGVVDHLIDHVVQARAVIGVADVHARALAHGVEALQHLDGVGAVFSGVGVVRLVGHVQSSITVRPARRRHATPEGATFEVLEQRLFGSCQKRLQPERADFVEERGPPATGRDARRLRRATLQDSAGN
jgi:hypothetical protein